MSEILKLTTSQKLRLDTFLQQEFPIKFPNEKDISNSKIRRLIIAGCVYVNGKNVIRPSFELRGKSEVKINFDREKFFYEKQPDDIKFEITPKDVLYENEDLIFINKPSHFPVEQTITGNRDNLHDKVVDYLWKKNPSLRNPPYVGIMHRLDRETSGVILFTKNRDVNKVVSQMFQTHNFTKEYLAVCECPKVILTTAGSSHYQVGDSFTVELFMGRISGKSQQGKWGALPESKGGQYSKTEFTIVKKISVENKQCFLIKCNLFTGRTHQIRFHLSSKGLPILGDELYGGNVAKRMYLHASRLASDGKTLEMEKSVEKKLIFDVKSEKDIWK